MPSSGDLCPLEQGALGYHPMSQNLCSDASPSRKVKIHEPIHELIFQVRNSEGKLKRNTESVGPTNITSFYSHQWSDLDTMPRKSEV